MIIHEYIICLADGRYPIVGAVMCYCRYLQFWDFETAVCNKEATEIVHFFCCFVRNNA